jgi:hypothetical protein
METFFSSNPGFRSRIGHHISFPDYEDDELVAIGDLILSKEDYRLSPDARQAFTRYIALRRTQPHFANARSVRNALDRARLRQANRLVHHHAGQVTADELMTIEAMDLLASRVFDQGQAGNAGA